jgi:hypothetical protein
MIRSIKNWKLSPAAGRSSDHHKYRFVAVLERALDKTLPITWEALARRLETGWRPCFRRKSVNCRERLAGLGFLASVRQRNRFAIAEIRQEEACWDIG